MGIKSLYDAFKAAAKRAELSPDFVQHDLRHRRVTQWLAEEKNPVHVKEAVGHSDLRTTYGIHPSGTRTLALTRG